MPKPPISPSHVALGKALRAARARAGHKTQRPSPDTVELDRSYYGAIERGEFNVTLATMLKIADGLDASVADLCSWARI
jgi:DNA-binding XRE family transcriptional regulator